MHIDEIPPEIYNDDHILFNIINHLDQHSKTVVALCSRRMNEFAVKALYRKIYINDTPIVKSNVINIEASWSFLGNNKGYGQGELIYNLKSFIDTISDSYPKVEYDEKSLIKTYRNQRYRNILQSIKWIRFNWDANQRLQLDILKWAIQGGNLQRIENMVSPLHYYLMYQYLDKCTFTSLEQAPALASVPAEDYMTCLRQDVDEHAGTELDGRAIGFFQLAKGNKLLNETLLGFKMFLEYIYNSKDLPFKIETLSTFLDPALIFAKPCTYTDAASNTINFQGLLYSKCDSNVFLKVKLNVYNQYQKTDEIRILPKLKIKDLKIHWRDNEFPINIPQYVQMSDEGKLPKLSDMFFNQTLETVTIISWDANVAKRNKTVLFELLDFENINDLSLISLNYEPDLISRFFDKTKNKFVKNLKKLKLDFKDSNSLKNIPLQDLNTIIDSCPNLTFLDIRSEYDYPNKRTIIDLFDNIDDYTYQAFEDMRVCDCTRCKKYLQDDLLKKNMLNLREKPEGLDKLNIFNYISVTMLLPYSKSVGVYPSVLTNQISSVDMCIKNSLIRMDSSHGFDVSRSIDNIKFVPNEYLVYDDPEKDPKCIDPQMVEVLYMKLQLMKRLYLEFYEGFEQGYGYDLKDELINLSFVDCANNTGMSLDHIKKSFISPEYVHKSLHYYYHYQEDFIKRNILSRLKNLKHLVFNECSYYVTIDPMDPEKKVIKPLFYNEGYEETEDLGKYEREIQESPLVKDKNFSIDELAVFFRFQIFHNIITDTSTGDSLKNAALESILVLEMIFAKEFEYLDKKYRNKDIPLATICYEDEKNNLGSFLKEHKNYKPAEKYFDKLTFSDYEMNNREGGFVSMILKKNITGLKDDEKSISEVIANLKKRAYVFSLPFDFYEYINYPDLNALKAKVNRLKYSLRYAPFTSIGYNKKTFFYNGESRNLDDWGRHNENIDKYQDYFTWEDEYPRQRQMNEHI
ncbi:hypothetical protein D499_0AG00210 [Hanseniaspora uvarum DSM 2768]|nr:hypothetical protein FOG50_03407 [Hanseniaspora uvarum]KKA01340.1 hypothetical protein D499_0AG00210 [Hanseniaspora uvarum DSM 2768]